MAHSTEPPADTDITPVEPAPVVSPEEALHPDVSAPPAKDDADDQRD